MFVADHHRPWYTIHGIFRPIEDLVLFAAAGCATYWRKRKERIALAWPSVEGCVQSGQIDCVGENGGCSAKLEYSYRVGEEQSGEYSEVFDSTDVAHQFIDAMKGGKVPIHYNPEKPGNSVLEPTDAEHLYITSPLDPLVSPAKLR